jgi:catechol 2,3-dioxygenase-like lactoylglutathione lyase family enzyme
VINGTHAIIYAEDAEAARSFFRDVLGLSHVDAGDGWLIFQLPPAEFGVHPTASTGRGAQGTGAHQLFLMCDDLAATVAELTAKGVEFTSPVTDQGYGLFSTLKVPGAGELGLYQPKHPTAYDLS